MLINTFGPSFQGGAGYASQNWLTLPKGTTTERFPDFGGRQIVGCLVVDMHRFHKDPMLLNILRFQPQVTHKILVTY